MKKNFATVEEQLLVCEKYKNGQSAVDIGKEYNVESTSIYRLLDRHNVERRTHSLCKRYLTCNHQFFDTYNELSCYWAGFCAGDAGITDNQLTLNLQKGDISHLEKFKKHLVSDHPVKMRSDHCRFTIRSQELCDGLLKFGIGPAKSLTSEYPKNLPEETASHFIRGIWDADGSFSFNKKKKSDCNISLAGTKKLLGRVQNVLVENCDLNYVKVFQQMPSNIYILRYGGKNQVERIVHYLYHDATVYLDRKYEKILSYLNE